MIYCGSRPFKCYSLLEGTAASSLIFQHCLQQLCENCKIIIEWDHLFQRGISRLEKKQPYSLSQAHGQGREERIMTREWRCRLTNDGEPSPRQAVRRISSPRFESTLVCSKLFLWRDWKYLTFILMWLWISFFVQLRAIKTSCVLFQPHEGPRWTDTLLHT